MTREGNAGILPEPARGCPEANLLLWYISITPLAKFSFCRFYFKNSWLKFGIIPCFQIVEKKQHYKVAGLWLLSGWIVAILWLIVVFHQVMIYSAGLWPSKGVGLQCRFLVLKLTVSAGLWPLCGWVVACMYFRQHCGSAGLWLDGGLISHALWPGCGLPVFKWRVMQCLVRTYI